MSLELVEATQREVTAELDAMADKDWDLKVWHAKAEAYLSKKLKKLGAGFGRQVFDLGGGRVIKIAYNQFGREQNQREELTWDDHQTSGIFMPIYATAEDTRWLVMGIATKIAKMADLWDLFGMAPDSIIDAAKGDAWSIGQANKNRVARAVLLVGKKMDMDFVDLVKPDSWGWHGGKWRLLDYGLGRGQVRRAATYHQY